MDSVKQILSRLITPSAFVEVDYSGRYGSAILKEPQCEDSQIDLRGIPKDTLIIDVDSFPKTKDFFMDKSGYAKRADYIIVDTQAKNIIYLEMKRASALDGREGLQRQVAGAAAIMYYCQKVFVLMNNKQAFLKDFKEHFVAVLHTSLKKRGTKPKSFNGSGESVEELKTIQYPTKLHYKMLTSKENK